MTEQQPNTPKEIIAQVIRALPDGHLAQFRGYFRDRLTGQPQTPEPSDLTITGQDRDQITQQAKRGILRGGIELGRKLLHREKPPLTPEERETRFNEVITQMRQVLEVREGETFEQREDRLQELWDLENELDPILGLEGEESSKTKDTNDRELAAQIDHSVLRAIANLRDRELLERTFEGDDYFAVYEANFDRYELVKNNPDEREEAATNLDRSYLYFMASIAEQIGINWDQIISDWYTFHPLQDQFSNLLANGQPLAIDEVREILRERNRLTNSYYHQQIIYNPEISGFIVQKANDVGIRVIEGDEGVRLEENIGEAEPEQVRVIEKEDIDPKVATLSKLKEQTSFLSSEELGQVPDYKLLRLMIDGYLTVDQVRGLRIEEATINSLTDTDQPPTPEEMLKFSIISLKDVYILIGKHYPQLAHQGAIGEQLRLRQQENVATYPGLEELNMLVKNIPQVMEEDLKRIPKLEKFFTNAYTNVRPGLDKYRRQIAREDQEDGLQALQIIADSYNLYETQTHAYRLTAIEDKVSSEGLMSLDQKELEDLATAERLNSDQINQLAASAPITLVRLINSGALNLEKSLGINIPNETFDLLDRINQRFEHRRPSASLLREFFAEMAALGSNPKIIEQIPNLILVTLLQNIHIYQSYANTEHIAHVPFSLIRQTIDDLDPLSFPDPENARYAQREFNRSDALSEQFNILYERLGNGDFSLDERVNLTTLYHDQRLTPMVERENLENLKVQATRLTPEDFTKLTKEAPYILARLLWDGDLSRRQAILLLGTELFRQTNSNPFADIRKLGLAIDDVVSKRAPNQTLQRTFENYLAREGRGLSRTQLAQLALFELMSAYTALFELPTNTDDPTYQIISIEAAKYILQNPEANNRHLSESHLEVTRCALERYEISEEMERLTLEKARAEGISVDDAFEALRG